MVIPEIAKWAKKKGIGLVGTADWTHPLWLRELQANLEETSPGIYKLKQAPTKDGNHLPGAPQVQPHLEGGNSSTSEVKFLLSTEIASIFSQGGKLRRIHTIVFAPNFEVVEKINEKLRLAGVNLMSDGRPMTGLAVRQLAEIVFSVSENCLVICSHAWTPWFGIYGDKGGFDSLVEAFGDLAKNIFAIETGLSSDPDMNWRVKELDNRAIVSFSDAHSPQKMGREATVFQIKNEKGLFLRNVKIKNDNEKFKISYSDIAGAIKQEENSNWEIGYTIEFYPEEGKYHYTGHRNCGVKQSPEETLRLGETCSVCGRQLTVGVMHRVEELASRNVKCQMSNDKWGIRWVRNEGQTTRPPYVRLVPLMEILAEALGSLFGSQKVLNEYNLLVEEFGSEFEVLLKTPVEEIAKVSGPKVAEGIKKVRGGDIMVEPGYDGVFGIVKIWPFDSAQGRPESEDVVKHEDESREQMSLF